MVSASNVSLIERVLRQCPSARAIVLYGSAARGEATGKSDVDILVLAEEQCRVELDPPYSVVVLTLDEWLGAREEFRAEVLRDGLALYASGIRLGELVAAKPWLLIRYTAPTPAARACAARAAARFERDGLLERVAPGAVLAPYPVAGRFVEKLAECGARISHSKVVLYRVYRLYCGRCPYCGVEIVEPSYEEAKRRLREHILSLHADRLREEARRLEGRGRGLPGGSLHGLAGFIAANSIREC